MHLSLHPLHNQRQVTSQVAWSSYFDMAIHHTLRELTINQTKKKISVVQVTTILLCPHNCHMDIENVLVKLLQSDSSLTSPQNPGIFSGLGSQATPLLYAKYIILLLSRLKSKFLVQSESYVQNGFVLVFLRGFCVGVFFYFFSVSNHIDM